MKVLPFFVTLFLGVFILYSFYMVSNVPLDGFLIMAGFAGPFFLWLNFLVPLKILETRYLIGHKSLDEIRIRISREISTNKRGSSSDIYNVLPVVSGTQSLMLGKGSEKEVKRYLRIETIAEIIMVLIVLVVNGFLVRGLLQEGVSVLFPAFLIGLLIAAILVSRIVDWEKFSVINHQGERPGSRIPLDAEGEGLEKSIYWAFYAVHDLLWGCLALFGILVFVNLFYSLPFSLEFQNSGTWIYLGGVIAFVIFAAYIGDSYFHSKLARKFMNFGARR
ncbi:MAG: hypothetical protein V1847_05300 [Candidatus Diapherotrites archaeon]